MRVPKTSKSLTITNQTGDLWPTERSSQMTRKLSPVHPGEILREEFLVPLKLTPYAMAAALNVPRTRIERIARESRRTLRCGSASSSRREPRFG
jgi:hypothetical protein